MSISAPPPRPVPSRLLLDIDQGRVGALWDLWVDVKGIVKGIIFDLVGIVG